MFSEFLKAKLHMGSVTQSELCYDGSFAIDTELLALADMREFEKIDIYNSAMVSVLAPILSVQRLDQALFP
jgi:aspartate 1-decarboxylase